MAKPIPVTADDHLREVAHQLRVLSQHTHSGVVNVPVTPAPITGSRTSDVADILQQLLTALDVLDIIDNETTG